MAWPLPSLRPSRLIETPDACPVTTTWKASNSFFAAASFAAAAAPAGGCAEGRIFCAAGATQTWAADAEPAAGKATNRGSVFKLSLLGWLLPGTAGAFRSGWPTQGACRLLHSRCAAPCPKQGDPRVGGDLCGRSPTRQHLRCCAEHRASDRLGSPAWAGSVGLRTGEGRADRGSADQASPSWAARPPTEGAVATGSSTIVGAPCALAGDVLQRTLPGVVAAG